MKTMTQRHSWVLLLPAAFALMAQARSSAPTGSSIPPATVVRSPARTSLLAAGDPVPSFRAVAHDNRVIDVAPGPRSDILVLYFYPMDDTPG